MDIGGPNRRKPGGTRGSRSSDAATPSRRATATRKAKPARAREMDAFDITIPSNLHRGHDVHKDILDAAERHGFDADNLFALRISLDEALVNAIKHGNRLDPSKTVRITGTISADRAEIFIEDQGPGFNRADVPDPTADENLHRCSGRGILLIETYMSEVKWDHGGRRLHMVRENR